jgi:cytochrome P450
LLSDEAQSAPKFLTFGAGPRFCPGRNLAFLEAKTALAMIARSFRLELDSAAKPVKEHYNFAVIPDGLHIRLARRSH